MSGLVTQTRQKGRGSGISQGGWAYRKFIAGETIATPAGCTMLIIECIGGGGGAGGMHVATNTQIVPGTYTVAVGAGGTGGTASDQMAGVGNLSWITPRRTISLSEPTGAFVTGETLTGETSGATGDVIIYYS